MSDIKLASSAKIMAWALFLVLALFTIAIGLSPVLGKTFSMIVAVTVMWFADGFLSHKWPQIFPSKIKSDLNFKNKSKVLTFITAAALMIVVIILIGSNIGGSSIRILSVSLLAIGILVVVLSYLELRE